ncbi:hypothetical protein P4N68_05945 [Corynebacterium felinum]|uniref:Cyclodipeptide synthase n=1 Tax=Corynebacterium felinum TaxID=131318 RepID=A0ABU2B4L7_9CORY|nr:hypothetical protein [Corynebacterium felinum]MDF5820620.1 hypothetical protein [Corynebacterium felinum]MDR7353557.1 hypothetical protein [Corynebacterium felinum]WJY95738.1 hypothetical protein CFELI_10700 [Corynebacterium felinum]
MDGNHAPAHNPIIIRNYGTGTSAEVTRMGLRVLVDHEKIGSPKFEWGLCALDGIIWKYGKSFEQTLKNLKPLIAKNHALESARDVNPQFFADCCIQSAGGSIHKQTLWLRYFWREEHMEHDREALKVAKQKLKTFMRHNPSALDKTSLFGFERVVLVLPGNTPLAEISDYLHATQGSYLMRLEDFTTTPLPDFHTAPFVTDTANYPHTTTINELIDNLPTNPNN